MAVPNGNAEAYWFAAQREIVGACCLGSFAPVTTPETSDKKPRKVKAARKRQAS